MSRPWHWTTTLPPSGRAMGTNRRNRIVSPGPCSAWSRGVLPPAAGRPARASRGRGPPPAANATIRTPEGRGPGRPSRGRPGIGSASRRRSRASGRPRIEMGDASSTRLTCGRTRPRLLCASARSGSSRIARSNQPSDSSTRPRSRIAFPRCTQASGSSGRRPTSVGPVARPEVFDGVTQLVERQPAMATRDGGEVDHQVAIRQGADRPGTRHGWGPRSVAHLNFATAGGGPARASPAR